MSHANMRRSYCQPARHITKASGTPKMTLIGTGSPLVVERRAADVLVIGDSAIAAAAAYSLARRGKKVVHLLDHGIERPPPAKEALRPLQLLDPDATLVSLLNESAAYMEGLEMQAGIPLLWRTQSLDIAATHAGSAWPAVSGGAGSPAMLLMSQLIDAAKLAGVTVAGVKSGDLLTPYPMLRLSNQISGCLQADGGVVNAAAVQKVLQSLGKRSGVMQRDNLILRGWKDTGSCLRVHASSRLQPDAVSVFEAEQVLLAPGAWPLDCLQLWGLQVQGLQLIQRCSLSCGAASDLARLPLLRYWNVPMEQANVPADTSQHQQHSSSELKQHDSKQSARDTPTTEAVAERGQDKAATSSAPATPIDAQSFTLFPCASSSSAVSKLVTVALQAQSIESCWQLPEPVSAQSREQLQAALRSNWQQAADMVKGLNGPPPIPDKDELEDRHSKQDSSTGEIAPSATAWDLISDDGLPVLGWHPSFEPGRVMLALGAGAAGGRQTDAYQLAPLLAKAAADALQGQPTAGLPVDADLLVPWRSVVKCNSMQGKEWGAVDVMQQMQSGELYRAELAASLQTE